MGVFLLVPFQLKPFTTNKTNQPDWLHVTSVIHVVRIRIGKGSVAKKLFDLSGCGGVGVVLQWGKLCPYWCPY